MKFYSHWQPLRNEDAHTALVFGFYRHAPAPVGLDVWLTRVLGRKVTSSPLTPTSFWPQLVSLVPGSSYTQPEIVFEANDGLPLTVVIEVKPGYGMHEIEQIRREVVDVASTYASSRVACIMVGADLLRPATTVGWEIEVENAVASHASHAADVELHYSSFADAGRVITEVAVGQPEWAEYAEDVVSQLRRKGLMGYEGAPMFDDLEGLSVSNAVEVFNRTILAARQFYLLLHSQAEFAALGLLPYEANFRMLRGGGSEVPTQTEDWFVTTVIISRYRHASLAAGTAVFAAFDLLGSGTGYPDLLVGVSSTSTGAYEFGQAIKAPQTLEGGPFEELALSGENEWRYSRRTWRAGEPGADIQWTLGKLRSALLSRKLETTIDQDQLEA